MPDNQKKKVRIADDFLKEDTDLKLKKSQKGDLRPSRSAVDLHLLDPDHEKHIGHGRHHHHHHGHHHHKSDTPEVERSAHSAINASQVPPSFFLLLFYMSPCKPLCLRSPYLKSQNNVDAQDFCSVCLT